MESCLIIHRNYTLYTQTHTHTVRERESSRLQSFFKAVMADRDVDVFFFFSSINKDLVTELCMNFLYRDNCNELNLQHKT